MTLENQLKITRDATMSRMPKPIMQVFKDSIKQIKVEKLKENALQLNDKVPNISLINIQGSTTQLSDLIQSEYLILNFYRGGWCPYCNMELREYERLQDGFNKLGVNIVAISPEITSLSVQTTHKNAISYPILTDRNAQFMKAIGIVFKLDEASKKEFVNFGMDFTQINGNDNYELPVPAVYVIDKEMKVVFVHFEEDYMTRLEPQELLNTLKNIN